MPGGDTFIAFRPNFRLTPGGVAISFANTQSPPAKDMHMETTLNAQGLRAVPEWTRRLLSAPVIVFLLILSAASAFGQNAKKSFSPGAYIIDMGQEPQTVANGLKPYGLVYQLIIVEGIPVQWAIDPAKDKDGADFTAGGKTYKAGSFIIPSERITDKVLEKLKTWKAKGVVVDGPIDAHPSPPPSTSS